MNETFKLVNDDRKMFTEHWIKISKEKEKIQIKCCLWKAIHTNKVQLLEHQIIINLHKSIFKPQQ